MNPVAAAGQLPYHAVQAASGNTQGAPQVDAAQFAKDVLHSEQARTSANADLAAHAAASVGEPVPAPSTDAIFSIQASLGLAQASAGRSGASSVSS